MCRPSVGDDPVIWVRVFSSIIIFGRCWVKYGRSQLCYLLCCSSGMTAIPCACLGIFLGGLLVKKLNLSALGAVRMAMLVNLVSTACYVSFLFLGCDTGPVAGITVNYSNE